jgi:ribosomal protein L9
MMMLFFGKKAVEEAEQNTREAEKIKAKTKKKIQAAEDSAGVLQDLLEANGFTLRIYVATGGKNKHGR